MRYTIVIFVFTFVLDAIAYEPEQAKTNQAHELANCAVYYVLMAECVSNNPSQMQLAHNLEMMAGLATELSVGLSNEEVTKARVQMAERDFRARMDNHCSNVSILMNELNETCSEAVQNPEQRFNYWLELED